MMLWIVLTVMTAAAAVLVAAPFLRRLDSVRAKPDGELAVFRDQLQEVEREAGEGLIERNQADAARNEIMRRALAADSAARLPSRQPVSASSNLAVIGIAGVVVLGSVSLYALNGRPELPSSTPNSRSAETGLLAEMTARGQQSLDGHDRGGTSTGLATVDEMIERLALRLKLQPDDAEGWRMLGWSYFGTERYPEAQEAYAKAVALRPDLAALQSLYGEAIVRAASGAVTQQARVVVARTLELDPKDPRARYFTGLAKEQDGDKRAALEDWIALLKDASPGEDWAGDLEQRVAEIAKEIGTDITGRLARPKGPTIADIRNAVGLPAEQQSNMIRGMVDGLASRLESSPHDEEGWLKLIRSYSVLGETEAAKRALNQALRSFAEASPERSRIAAAARELGLAP
ncbi:MAG: c-type cytochrome biogenesis protein CcmI [Hyphomicrobiaceae bacterium]